MESWMYFRFGVKEASSDPGPRLGSRFASASPRPAGSLLLAISASLRFVSHGFADGALYLELGGCAVPHGVAEADGEFAIIGGGVLRLASTGCKQCPD
jgi:hypothetical protein